MPRIVSLIPSATEIVAALGFGDQLVGRSHECDFPAGLDGLPVLTRPKLAIDRPSAEIDRQVRDLVSAALSVYAVDAEALQALTPDVIVTQAQCEVCAVSLAEVERAVADWTAGAPRIVSLEAMTLDGIWGDIEAVAAALGAQTAGHALVQRLEGRMEAISAEAEGLDTRPRVACIEWIEPLMAAGSWVPELVEMAGGDCLFGKPGVHAPAIGYDDLAAADPDAMVMMPCGFDIARTLAELPPLTARPDWHGLAAVRHGRVAVTDGNQYFNRPGPRILEALEILAEILHPEAFDFGHAGRSWRDLRTTGAQVA